VAVGVGVALARAGRERRSARTPRTDGSLGLGPGERLAGALKRMALGQSEDAIEQLEHADDPGRAVHETRKALKRLRALVRVLEGELGRKATARENAALAQTGRLLAEARDAEVLLATLDALIERHPAKLAGRKGVARLRRHLAQELMLARRRTIEDPLTRARALGELRAFRERVLVWDLSDRQGIAIVEPGLQRLYTNGRERWQDAEDARGDRTHEMHEWRKRVKDLRYVAEMLESRGPAPTRKNGKPDQRLHQLASRADALGELLGDEHDLAVLAAWISANAGRRPVRAGRGTRRTLLALIARRRRELRRQALREGERLYRARPKKFLRRVRASSRAGA
jgi:CHAD domain-containing protein